MTQETALAILKTGASVFLTGSAGTGKTYVLNEYISFLKQMNLSYAVTASTGIAATHLRGMTIHSWSGMGIKNILSEYDIDAIESKAYLQKRLTQTAVLIIDEVSMLHRNHIDMLDTLLRTVRKNENPFGGVQMIFCGDFFQLPPVIKQAQISVTDFAFSSTAWKRLDPVVCYLVDNYRQQQDELLYILSSIRNQEIDDDVYALLETYSTKKHTGVYTRLYTHNVDVDAENEKELGLLAGNEKKYEMTSSGKESLVLSLKKSCLAPEVLRLKIGARVMFVKNDPEHMYMNGTLGEVVGFADSGYPTVELVNGKHVVAEPVEWVVEEDGKIKARIGQVPLRLAWAITIHKSQGMSLDTAEIDLSKAFSFGQGYVALSRLRSISGLALSGFSQNSLLLHPDVVSFDKTLQELSLLAESAIGEFSPEEQIRKHKAFVINRGGTWNEKKEVLYETVTSKSTYQTTKELLVSCSSFKEVVQERGVTLGTILKHCEVLKDQGELQDISHLDEIDMNRISIIVDVFRQVKTDKLTPVIEYLTKADFQTTYDEVRMSRLFL